MTAVVRASVLLAAALLLPLPLAAGGGTLPQPLRTFEADYRVVKSGIRLGTARIRLEAHAEGWSYRSVTEAEGLFSLFVGGKVTDRAVFTVHEGMLRPLRYRHDEPDDEDDVRMVFDWATGSATIERPAGTREQPLEPGTHDPFTVILSVIRAVAAGEESVHYPGIDDEGERVPLRFEVSGRETVEVPLGRFEAHRVRRIRDDKRSTTTWLAPGLGWLPVMIEQRRKGELVARMELERLDGRSPAEDGEPVGR